MSAGSIMLSSATLRIRHLTWTIYQLGPRPLYECHCDLVAMSSGALDVLESYGGLAAYGDFIAANHGRDLPPIVHLVRK
jgi:hypothetical protein